MPYIILIRNLLTLRGIILNMNFILISFLYFIFAVFNIKLFFYIILNVNIYVYFLFYKSSLAILIPRLC